MSPEFQSPKIKDVVLFVAGTTDPGNFDCKMHKSNSDYWHEENSKCDNICDGVKALQSLYSDLYVEDKFFSWSGDNSNEARKEGGERLLDLLSQVYKDWKTDTVYLHLIGHSHGGNVINEFSKQIASNVDFPEAWKIKSITYLSTPFFQKQHQLNTTKLHPQCKIINVYNKYDLTQRFIADYTLNNLEVFFNFFYTEKFITAKNTIQNKKINTSPLKSFYIKDKDEGPQLWRETGEFLEAVEELADISIEFFTENVNKIPEALDSLLKLFGKIKKELEKAKDRFLNTSRTEFGHAEYIEDLDIASLLTPLVELMKIEKGIDDSYLLHLIELIIGEEGEGIVDRIDDTGQDPSRQASGYEIIQVPIAHEDEFDKSKNSKNFDSFIFDLESSVKNNMPQRHVLARLLSQFVTPTHLSLIITGIDVLEIIVTGELDKLCKTLRAYLNVYLEIVKKFNKDLKDSDLEVGDIPYFILMSHGLSHTKFFDPVKEHLISAFGSERKLVPEYSEKN